MNSTLTISNCGHEHEQFTREHRDQIFKCGVCKELGNGARYICSHGCTDFHVHTDCVDPPSSLQHPFYPHCQFQFHRDRIRYKRCDACGLDIKGSMYHCSKNRKDLHPCCAKLPLRLGSFIEETETAGHEIPLILCPKLSSKCFECGHKKLRDGNFMSWGYTTECNTIWYHVACAKETLNEIYFMRSANYAPRQGEGNGGRLISRASDVSETLQSVLQSLPSLSHIFLSEEYITFTKK